MPAGVQRGVEVDFPSPGSGKVGWTPGSGPYFQDSQEPDDLVSKSFLPDKKLLKRSENTTPIKNVDLGGHDTVHVAVGRYGAGRATRSPNCTGEETNPSGLQRDDQ
jgi:hypothetical protein